MAAVTARRINWTIDGAHSQFPRAVGARRPVVAKAVHGAASNSSDEYHLTADTIAWSAKYSATLKKRIAQVRAAEVVADSTSTRPELPPIVDITVVDVEHSHNDLCQWHEDQWQKLRASQLNNSDDDLGHFGIPS